MKYSSKKYYLSIKLIINDQVNLRNIIELKNHNFRQIDKQRLINYKYSMWNSK